MKKLLLAVLGLLFTGVIVSASVTEPYQVGIFTVTTSIPFNGYPSSVKLTDPNYGSGIREANNIAAVKWRDYFKTGRLNGLTIETDERLDLAPCIEKCDALGLFYGGKKGTTSSKSKAVAFLESFSADHPEKRNTCDCVAPVWEKEGKKVYFKKFFAASVGTGSVMSFGELEAAENAWQKKKKATLDKKVNEKIEQIESLKTLMLNGQGGKQEFGKLALEVNDELLDLQIKYFKSLLVKETDPAKFSELEVALKVAKVKEISNAGERKVAIQKAMQ